VTEILWVDDEPWFLEPLQEKIRARLPQVSIATCVAGSEALARLAERPPDLLVLDVLMPVQTIEEIVADALAGAEAPPDESWRLGGLKVLQEVLAKGFAKARIVIYSIVREGDAREDALRNGVNLEGIRYIHKETDLDEAAALISGMVGAPKQS